MAEQDLLLLVRQMQDIIHLCLSPSENAGHCKVPQGHCALVGCCDLHICGAHQVPRLDGLCELFQEDWERAKSAWADEVEQRPQLLQPVLYWGT
eukprot:1916239-Amphidinium_carterae.1